MLLNIKQKGEIENIVSYLDRDADAKSIMQLQNKLCDCHLRQKDMFARMLTKSPSGAKSIAGGSMYDDVMSKGSLLDQDLYFRQFRSPCRKTCSTTHNPMYHCNRWNKKMRPQSAEGSKAKKQAEALKSDWQNAGINNAVKELEAREKMLELKQRMKETGYNSENENSTELLKLYPTDKNINHSEIEDMKNILARARERE